MDFSWDAAFEGRKAAQRDRKDAHLERDKKAPHPHFWGQIQRFWGFLDPFDQNETYHTSNEDKIEHMKGKICKVDERSL